MKNKTMVAKNKYYIKATEMTNTFFRKWKKFSTYTTGNGKENRIEKVTNKHLYFVTEKGINLNPISKKDIIEAATYLFYKRTVTLKLLGKKFSNFNSSLMGILKVLFLEISKIHKTARGALQITIRGLRFFFSGMDKAMEADWSALNKGGANFILCSYYYLRNKRMDLFKSKIREFCEKGNAEGMAPLLLDCGEFSVYNAFLKGKEVKPICIYEYAKFINTHKDMIYGYFNLDVVGDAVKSKENADLLKELTGVSPVPIWHCNPDNWQESDWDALEKMIQEEHPLIAIGGTRWLYSEVKKRAFFEVLFEKHPTQNFHWLGGSSNLMLDFPFFSADSSGWIQGRKKNQIYSFESEEAATRRAPQDWDPLTCLEYNVRMLSSFEEMHDGLQIRMDMVVA